MISCGLVNVWNRRDLLFLLRQKIPFLWIVHAWESRVTWRPRNRKVTGLLPHAGKQQLLFRHMSLPILPFIASSFFWPR